jgi:hypothetical protein
MTPSTISDLRDFGGFMGELIFFVFDVQSRVLAFWDVRVFSAGLHLSPDDTLFWGKAFSIGQLVIDCSEFICYLTSLVMSYYSLW